MAVASVDVWSLPNRFSSATALAVVVLLTALSLLTAGLGLVELSGCIIIWRLEVDTWVSGASVNLVDLDAGVEGVFVVFIGNFVFDETLIDKKIIQVVELGVEC